MAQQLRVLTALAQDLSLCVSADIGTLTTHCSSSSGISSSLYWSLWVLHEHWPSSQAGTHINLKEFNVVTTGNRAAGSKYLGVCK